MNRRLIAPLLTVLALALAGAGAAGAATTRVVMSGLDNPRGLAIGPLGALYVAEAGRGGAGPCFTPPIRGGLSARHDRRVAGSGSASDANPGGLPSYDERRDGRAGRPARPALGLTGLVFSVGWAGEGLPRSVLPGVASSSATSTDCRDRQPPLVRRPDRIRVPDQPRPRHPRQQPLRPPVRDRLDDRRRRGRQLAPARARQRRHLHARDLPESQLGTLDRLGPDRGRGLAALGLGRGRLQLATRTGAPTTCPS